MITIIFIIIEILLLVLLQITKEKWPELLALDELGREMRAKRVLCGYTALTPEFPPTFKRIRDIGEAGLEE